jgi:Arc/MetJ family transcription regulator
MSQVGEGAMAEATRMKRIRIDQAKIDRAMQLLGTRTEAETIEAALDLVVFGTTLAEGVRAMKGAGLVDVFAADSS